MVRSFCCTASRSTNEVAERGVDAEGRPREIAYDRGKQHGVRILGGVQDQHPVRRAWDCDAALGPLVKQRRCAPGGQGEDRGAAQECRLIGRLDQDHRNAGGLYDAK